MKQNIRHMKRLILKERTKGLILQDRMALAIEEVRDVIARSERQRQ